MDYRSGGNGKAIDGGAAEVRSSASTGGSRLLSLGMKLAVPYNHDPHMIRSLESRSASIAEVFVPVPLDICGTFRTWNGPDPEEYRRNIPALVRETSDMGIALNMAVNPAFVPPGDYGAIVDYIGQAASEGVGSFTIGDIGLAMTVRDRFPDLVLIASATADISRVTLARHWVNQVGVSRIVPSRIVNKLLQTLSDMHRLGVEIEVIPNEHCLPACPFMFQHSVSVGMRDSIDDHDFQKYCAMCAAMKVDAPWEHYKTEIVPASVFRYQGLVSLLKLAGRDATTGYILDEVDRFIALDSDGTGFLGGYREPEDVIEKVSACDRVCEQCGYCEKVFVATNPGWKERAMAWKDRFVKDVRR